MGKIWIDADERYPFYSVQEKRGLEVEATAEQIERWARAGSEWEAAQDEMGDLYEAAHEAERERLKREKVERAAAEKAERDRLTRERDREAKARRARQDAMWEQIQASGGVVYDASGKRIGTVDRAMTGVRLEP